MSASVSGARSRSAARGADVRAVRLLVPSGRPLAGGARGEHCLLPLPDAAPVAIALRPAREHGLRCAAAFSPWLGLLPLPVACRAPALPCPSSSAIIRHTHSLAFAVVCVASRNLSTFVHVHTSKSTYLRVCTITVQYTRIVTVVL